jgi:hypothetical protein
MVIGEYALICHSRGQTIVAVKDYNKYRCIMCSRKFVNSKTATEHGRRHLPNVK